jgi:hypothetical protein
MAREDSAGVGARDGGVEHRPQGGADLGVVGRHRERNYGCNILDDSGFI